MIQVINWLYVLKFLILFSCISAHLTSFHIDHAGICALSLLSPSLSLFCHTQTHTRLLSPTQLFYIIQIVHLPCYLSSALDLSLFLSPPCTLLFPPLQICASCRAFHFLHTYLYLHSSFILIGPLLSFSVIYLQSFHCEPAPLSACSVLLPTQGGKNK